MIQKKDVFTFGLVILFLVAVTGAAAVSETDDVLTLYFGSAPREVGLFPPGGEAAGYLGPTSFAVDAANNLYVLDAAHCSVKIFSPAGILEKVVEYPPFSLDGKPVLCVDLAVTPGGIIYIANQTENVVWKFSPEGDLLETIGEKPGGASHFGFLIKIHVDVNGSVYGADRQAMKVFKFDSSGKKEKALSFNTCSVTYSDGSLVMLDISEKTKSLSVKRLAPDLSRVDHVATLKPRKSILDAYPIGIDSQENLFLFTSLGVTHGDFWRKVETLLVIVVGPDGKIKKKIPLPEFPAFPLNRHFAVTGDGRLLAVETDEERFRIVEYR